MNLWLFAGIALWVFFAVINFSWIEALKENREYFNEDDDGWIFIIMFGPIGSFILLMITYIPPFSKWVKEKFKGIV